MQYHFKTMRLSEVEEDKFCVPLILDTCEYDELKSFAGASKYRCVIIVDKNGIFKNIVTQGDIIRYELKAKSYQLKDLLTKKSPGKVALNASAASKIAMDENMDIVPIKNLDHTLQGVLVRSQFSIDKEFSQKNRSRIALIISGGKGTRLGVLTKKTPKPLLNVGNKPLIEHVMSSIEFLGFNEFHLLCGHLVHEFEKFSKLTRFNVKVFAEDTPLGTGGPLIKWVKENEKFLEELLKSEECLNIIIANGDLLFDLDGETVDNFEKSSAKIAIVGRRIQTQIKFGTMVVDPTGLLVEFVEKPSVEHIVNTGVYFISMDKTFFDCIRTMPIKYTGMPDLLQFIANQIEEKISIIEICGNYLDLGTPDDLNKLKEMMES